MEQSLGVSGGRPQLLDRLLILIATCFVGGSAPMPAIGTDHKGNCSVRGLPVLIPSPHARGAAERRP